MREFTYQGKQGEVDQDHVSEGTIIRRGKVRRDKRIWVRDLQRTWEDCGERESGRTSQVIANTLSFILIWCEVIAGFLAKWDYLA